MKSVFIISGPAGAGKSTTSRKIAERLEKSAHIEGDLVDHMVVGGYEVPWLSDYHTDLIWRNMLTLTQNYLDHDHDVVIDYVAFMKSAEYIAKGLQRRAVSVKFVILTPNEKELLRRDAERIPEYRMGQRCIAGLHEILDSDPPKQYLMDSTQLDVEAVIHEIMSNDKFLVNL